ncbi:uncharacterized protein LOC118424610 isoform X2 [Branchiostoma floridae]|uniref:Uncharacterized protein LOC118424610 isoform X2 n=1 Tax=Branchiostoma floridae TaxID=7739 RepID=A0A9J7LV11_BRAFL|nr:uncharacterized protein LOC118424610 isoform X2 [Branchiostoma floridae]
MYRRLQEIRQSHELYRVPNPPSNPKPANQAPQDVQRQTRKVRRHLRKAPQVLGVDMNEVMDSCEEADRHLKAGHRPEYIPARGFSDNMPNRYMRSSPTEEELDRALDEHAKRLYHHKLQTQMFGEDLSASKLPSKKRGKKVRAQEKLHQLEQERHNAVPFNHEHQLLQSVCTEAMFGEDLSDKSSATRRVPTQPSLVGGRNHRTHDMQGAEKTRYQVQPEPDDHDEAVYITLEDLDFRANRLKQAADWDLSSDRTATKLPSLAPQRHRLAGKRTAAAATISGRHSLMDTKPHIVAMSDNAASSNISGHYLLKDPKPPVAAKSDNVMAAEKLQTKKRASDRRTRDSRTLKRRCESPSGLVRSKH